jgi:hypothetical protein
MLEKKREYNETVHQLFVDYKKAYDSVRRKVLYNILREFCVPMKLVTLIKVCLTETYSKVLVGKHLSNNFTIQNGLKQWNVLLPLLFNFSFAYTIRKIKKNRVRPKLKGAHQLLVYADDVNLLGDNIDTVKKNTDTFIDVS